MIRVLLAEDQALLRGLLSEIIGREPDFEVVAAVGTGEAAIAAAQSEGAEVALLDIELPGLDGIAAAAEIRRLLPTCRVLILTVFDRPGYLKRALAAGATGFLLKDAAPAELVAAIRRVAAGGRVVDHDLAMTALAEGESPLTERERQVLALSAGGAGVDEVARSLHLTSGTVRNYLSIAIQKMGAANRVEAAHRAEAKGWL